MTFKRWILVVVALTSALVVAGMLAAAGDEQPPVDVAGLPFATSEPPCEPGQGVGRGHILWTEGSSFETPRGALEAAWVGMNGLGIASDFSGRYVRLGYGPNATLAKEFTLEYSDGRLRVRALALWQSDGGWLVSGHEQCFTP